MNYESIDPELNLLSKQVIGAAIEVHRHLGPGFAEVSYQRAMAIELELRAISFMQEVPVQLKYKGRDIREGKIDLLIEEKLVVELKAAEANPEKYKRQVLTYLKSRGNRLGLVINFEASVLTQGISRVIN